MARIRQVSNADLASIAAIEDECFGEDRFPLACFRAYLRRPNSVFLLAADGGEAAAYVVGTIDNRFRPPVAKLDSLAVRAAWRRRGLGGALLERFEREVRRYGAAEVALEVERTNSGARRLYRQAGYRREADLPNYYGRGRHGVRMVKPIVGS